VRVLGRRPAIPILMYHRISGDPEGHVSPYYRLATSPAMFRQQMCWLKEHGHSVVSLSDAVTQLNQPDRTDRRAVITFDDAFIDVYTEAWPILAEFGFTATVFVPTGFVENPGGFNGRRCLSWAQIRELYSFGITFGSHSVSHPELYRLAWPAIRREL